MAKHNKRLLFLSLIAMASLAFCCGILNNSASAYTPEYYYFNMDSLHKSLQRGGVVDNNGFARETMFTYVIPPDPNYVSSKVRLSETEKQWVITLLYHEIGGCKMGPIITAQMIRDSYLYFCSTNPGHYCTRPQITDCDFVYCLVLNNDTGKCAWNRKRKKSLRICFRTRQFLLSHKTI